MTFECIDPVGCDCHCHASWETHLPVCPTDAVPLTDAVGKPLHKDAEQGHCAFCRRNWRRPWRHSVSTLGAWDWRPRDLYPNASMPATEAREMAVPHADEHADMAAIPEAPMEDQP